jgi:hypothetical protein
MTGTALILTAAAAGDSTATVGQLVTAAVITAVASVAGTLALSMLTFKFVRQKELGVQLRDTMLAKSVELDQQLDNATTLLERTLRNELTAYQEKHVQDRRERIRGILVGAAGPLGVAAEELSARLANILENQGHVMLQHDWDSRSRSAFPRPGPPCRRSPRTSRPSETVAGWSARSRRPGRPPTAGPIGVAPAIGPGRCR